MTYQCVAALSLSFQQAVGGEVTALCSLAVKNKELAVLSHM